MNSLQARLNEEFADVSLNIEASQIISAYKKQKKRTVSAFAISSLCAVILLTVINLNTGVITEFARTTGELLSSYFAPAETNTIGETSIPQSPTNPTDTNSASAVAKSTSETKPESSEPSDSAFTASTTAPVSAAEKATETAETSSTETGKTDPETQPATEPETEPVYSASGDFKFKLLSDGTASITGYVGSENRVVIPKELDDIKVTKISPNAFSSFKGKSVIIPASVTELCEKAFSENSSLEQVVIPKSVRKIGAKAFYNCEKLNSVSLSAVESIGESAFFGCSSIEEIKPNKVKIISENAFAYSGIKNLHLGLGVTVISRNAFSHCTSLSKAELPRSLTLIAEKAFYHCTSLNRLTVPAEVYELGDMCIGYYQLGKSSAKLTDFVISCYDYSAAKSYAVRRGFAVNSLGDSPFPTAITLESYVLTLKTGSSCKIMYEVENPVGAVEFKSENPDIVKVDSDGIITALKSGTARVTVSNNGVSKTLVVIAE